MQSSVDNPDLSELQSGIGTGPIGIKCARPAVSSQLSSHSTEHPTLTFSAAIRHVNFKINSLGKINMTKSFLCHNSDHNR